MCGISGIVSDVLTRDEMRDAVSRMCRAMVHRGPDDEGIQVFDGACLGMRRLAILDLTPQGHQPMANEDGSLSLVFNGEIYNFASLRAVLEQRGHRFHSKTDCEPILHLYEERGIECLDALRGMFGLGIWDDQRRQILLARDRLGIKPLYYAETARGLVFASEVRALLASNFVERTLEPAALDQYLAFGYVPPPYTLVRGICALLPGHRLRWYAGKATIDRWWSLPAPGAVDCAEDEMVPRLRSLLDESIRLHRVSDVPIGAFLSGGIDSTAVVGLMAQQIDQPVRTFSIGFADGPAELNELAYAREAAAAFGTCHTEVVLSAADVETSVERAVQHVDQPSFDGLNTFFVSQAARRAGVTVALSGLGGDELFGGYDSYRMIPRWAGRARVWGKLPVWFRRAAVAGMRTVSPAGWSDDRQRKLARTAHVESAADLYALARLLMWPDEVSALYTPRTRATVTEAGGDNGLDRLRAETPADHDPWRLVTALELSTFMGWRLLRDTDAMSMAHSLEVRVPLIDHKVVEFVCGLPSGWERRFGRPKGLLVESVRDILPRGILDRRKQGFAFPLEHWMRHQLRPLIQDVLSSSVVRARGLFGVAAVERLKDAFFAGTRPYPEVWQLVVLELWMRDMLDSPAHV